MLKKLINYFTPGSSTPVVEGPHMVPSGEHSLTSSDISRGALETVEILEKAGYQAYLVGGCVRDMLLDLHPKDFDVATNATPEQAKSLFRRSRIIGRRFRIVHVYFGRETIEVTTFRASHTEGNNRNAVQSDNGMLLRDNVFGDISEDAKRRDFTVNALYYHPKDNSIYDYANGLVDIQQRKLTIIGDPETRYREDPVRMLRAARFAGKLGFEVAQHTAEPLPRLAHLLADVAPARLFDELLKLFFSGQALATFRQLQEYDIFRHLFPETAECLEGEECEFSNAFIEQAFTNTDKRIRNNQRVTPAFLLAALLWPAVARQQAQLQARGESPAMAMQKAGGLVVSRQISRTAIPRRFTQPMREIWELQLRLPNRHGTRAEHLVSLKRFRAAFDFILLREQSGEDMDGLGHWWTKYQEADQHGRRSMVEALGAAKGKRNRRRRPKKRSSGNSH